MTHIKIVYLSNILLLENLLFSFKVNHIVYTKILTSAVCVNIPGECSIYLSHSSFLPNLLQRRNSMYLISPLYFALHRSQLSTNQ